MMTGAGPEAVLAGGVALYDLSYAMPRHDRKVYPLRDVSGIRRVYLHHSGARGKPGALGAYRSAMYVVDHRDFPGAAYHFWIPYPPAFDASDRISVYRLQPDDVRAWHTGGVCNGHGLGVALQGNLTESGPSDSQIECLEALLPWLAQRHEGIAYPNGLSWHSEASRWGGRDKPACPGPKMVEWAQAYRMAA